MPSKTATTLTLDSIGQFRLWLSAKGRSDRTARAYSTDVRVMLSELGETSLEKAEFEMAAMNWLTANRRRVAPKTTARRLTSLRAYSQWAGWGDPLADYSAPAAPPGQPHPLPEGIEGVRRLIETARGEHIKALVALCGLCGLRISEALEVKPSDFDVRSMALKVHGKGEKIRYVPVSEEAWKHLCRPVVRSFADGRDAPVVGLHDRYAREAISRLGEKAGLKRHIASHDLRATFATAVYDATLDIRLVQEILGHSSVVTTQVYTGVRFKAMREAVELS